MEEIKEKVFISHTCISCGRAFVDADECEVENIAPDYKNCPDCIKNKNKNNSKDKVAFMKRDRLYSHLNNIPQHLKKYGGIIEEKALEILNREIELGRKTQPSSCYKDALEIAEYQYEEDNE